MEQNKIELTIMIPTNSLSSTVSPSIDEDKSMDEYVAIKKLYRFVNKDNEFKEEQTSRIQHTLYGNIQLAERISDGKKVAIKISHQNLRISHVTKDHYINVHEDVKEEARVLKFIHCKEHLDMDGRQYICELLEETEDSKYHYLVFPYYHQDLLNYWNENIDGHELDEDIIRRLMFQIIKGVKFLHSIGVAHLDISLENIMIDADEHVHIIDFGVARINPHHNKVNHVDWKLPPIYKNNELPGKPSYMSPELLTSNFWRPFECDVFTIGVVLYSLVVGKSPFVTSVDSFASVLYNKGLTTIAEDAKEKHRQGIDFSINETNKVLITFSIDCFDLISKMLCLRNKRIKMEEIVNHSWIVNL
jgi:serine/threonine protein kinase